MNYFKCILLLGSLVLVFFTFAPQGISIPALGQGIVIGVIDSGIDWTHLDFRVDRDGDGFEEVSRIRFIWDQTLQSDPFFGLAPSGFDYGIEFTQAALEAALAIRPTLISPIFQKDNVGHGTWVAGIAAGDGSSSSLSIRGIAPFADLIVVKLAPEANPLKQGERFLDGIRYLIARAKSLHHPLVINVSLKLPFFPSDGNDVISKKLDALILKNQVPVVVAAGNSSRVRTHIHRKIAKGETLILSVVVPQGTIGLSANWWLSQPNEDVQLRVLDPKRNMLGEGSTLTAIDTFPTNGIHNQPSVWALQDPKIGKGLFFHKVEVTQKLPAGRWAFELTSLSNVIEIDGKLSTIGSESATFLQGDTQVMINVPATARNVITIGSYNLNNYWNDQHWGLQFAENFSLKQLSSFTSCGPSQDGRIKPEMVAPGAWIIGALAPKSIFAMEEANILVDDAHFIGSGTSASAAFVSGVVAIMRQINPGLAVTRIKEILIETATKDMFTGATPNSCWGYGKVNLDAALQALLGFKFVP